MKVKCDQLSEASNNANGTLPEWGRVADVQRLLGIKRGTLYTLIASGHIKSVSMRRKGNVRGCRLILLSSVAAYLQSLLETQTGGGL